MTLTFLKLVLILFISVKHCQGQTSPNFLKTPSGSNPVIIGSPPSFTFGTGSLIDTTLVGQYIRAIFQDSKGNFWFGPTGQSVARYDGNTLRYFTKEEFFDGNTHVKRDYGNSVHAIAEDTEGNVWFGTHLGLIQFNGERFRSFIEKDGLENLNISRHCILSDEQGVVWIGTSKGLYQYDPQGAKKIKKLKSFPTSVINGIMEDGRGNIWVAVADQGIFYKEGAGFKRLEGIPGLGNNYAGGIAHDNDGNYWFASKKGICKYDGNSITEITSKEGLGNGETWGLYVTSSGIIWHTARGSTTRYNPALPLSDPKAMTIFTPKDGINCCVQSMYEDREGNMWWGTGQGLYRFDGNQFYQVKQSGPWD